LITITLALGTLGLAVPFGSASGPFTFELTPLELIISGLAFIGSLGLLLDFLHPWRSYLWRTAFAEGAVGFLWMSSAIYELINPGEATINWRIGHFLMYLGYAALALTTWRWVNRGNTRSGG
jgi:hypothetical protein